jgi:hypothetical protein
MMYAVTYEPVTETIWQLLSVVSGWLCQHLLPFSTVLLLPTPCNAIAANTLCSRASHSVPGRLVDTKSCCQVTFAEWLQCACVK